MTTVRSRILRGVGANAFGQAVNVVVQVVGLPVYLAAWGVERYGEWLVLSSLASFLAMSDVGFASAAANEMAMRVGRGDREGAVVVYQSMWLLLCGLGGVVLAAVLAILWLTPAATWLPLALTAPGEAAATLSLLAVSILLTQQMGVLQAGFRCDGQYARGVMLVSVVRLVEFAAQAGIAFTSGRLAEVAAASVAARILGLTSLAVAQCRRVPWLSAGFSQARLAELRSLIRPALAFMGMPLGQAISNQGMVQVIAATMGPAAVATFSAHRALTNVTQQLMSVINQALWPEFSLTHGAGDQSRLRQMHRQGCRISLWLTAGVSLLLALGGALIFRIWSQGRLEFQASLFAVLLVSLVLRALWQTSSMVPIAINRHAALSGVLILTGTAACAVAYALARIGSLSLCAVPLVAADVALTAWILPRSLRLLNDTVGGCLAMMLRPPKPSFRHFTSVRSGG